MNNALVPIIKAERMLAEANTIPKITHIANLAARAAEYAKRAGMETHQVNRAKKVELDCHRPAAAVIILIISIR